jgi:K+-sensing histidine kinase KdpD
MIMDQPTLALMAGCVHELRTSLAAIGGFAELLEMGVQGPLTSAQAASLARIRSNQEQMVATLASLMTFSEIASGQMPVSPQPTELAALVREITDRCAAEARARHVTVHVTTHTSACAREGGIDHGFPHVLTDPVVAAVVIRELLRDAIANSREHGTVQLSVRDDAAHAIVDVQSMAPFIDAQGADAVFVPFARDASGSRLLTGPCALALPIARIAARATGAEVRAVTDADCRTVRLEVPWASAPSPAVHDHA